MRTFCISVLVIIASYHHVYSSVTSDSANVKRSGQKTEEKYRDEDYEPFLRLYLGGFYASPNTSITVNSERLGRGTTIDLERISALDNNILVPRLELIWNFGKRHELDFTFWTARRKRTRELSEDIQFADTIFYANAALRTRFNVSNYSLTYRYSFFATERWNAGLSIGGKLLNFYADLEANLNANAYSENRRVLVPIPLLGVHGSFIPANNFLIRGTIEYFTLGINDYNFRTFDSRIGVEYFFLENLGVGVDFHYFDTKIRRVPSGRLNGEINFDMTAVSLFIGLRI